MVKKSDGFGVLPEDAAHIAVRVPLPAGISESDQRLLRGENAGKQRTAFTDAREG